MKVWSQIGEEEGQKRAIELCLSAVSVPCFMFVGYAGRLVRRVIDKLEVRVPVNTEYTPEFGDLYSNLRNDPINDPFRISKHYAVVGDLRPFGHEMILHAHCRHGASGNHKVELTETGKRPFCALVNEIEEVFQVDAMKLEIMRVDCAVDVEGVPVWAFQDSLRAKRKQVVNDIENAEQLVRMGRGDMQTIYFGRRPNCFRIYNKIAEQKVRYSALKRRTGKHEPIPSFSAFCGYPEKGYVLTRVERQYGGGRVPKEISTLSDLSRRIHYLNPFEPLEIVNFGKPEPDPEDHKLTNYLAGIGLRGLIRELGMQRARRLVNRSSSRNAARIFRKYGDFLPPPTDGIAFPDLRELFERSITRQVHPYHP